MKLRTRLLSLVLSLALLACVIGVTPVAPVTALTATFNFNFMNNDSAYTSHAGFRVIAFPACGWMALNNISSEIIPHNKPIDVTVEVEYFWENMNNGSWMICRANSAEGTDATSIEQSINASSIVANKWTTWTINYSGIYFGTRPDTTDLFFSFNGSGGNCYIRSIKVYETGKPENYVSMDAEAEAVPGDYDYPFQDPSLSFEERAADLVSRLTLEEKLQQFGSNNPGIGRLGIKNYNYWRECLHGVARMHEDTRVTSNTATSFPYSIAMGASWNPELIQAIGAATSDEARGFNNEYGIELNYFSPTINVSRDPRWGRAHESYSEDTFLTSLIGAGLVNGLQGDDPVFNKANATIKHYALNNTEFDRETGNMVADNRAVLEYYTRAFKYISLNTDVKSIMSAYNRVNGVPASANSYLLTELLRERWNFDGFFVSDCGAVADIYEDNRHNWKPTKDMQSQIAIDWADMGKYTNAAGLVTDQGGTALALLAGLDLNCGFAYGTNLAQALNDGLITMGDIDKALTRIFTSRFETGEFDQDKDPYRTEAYALKNQQESEAHRQLAEDAADEGVVLLQNNGILPLSAKDLHNVVLIGENVNQVVLGGYSGKPSEQYSSTPLQGVTNLLKDMGATTTVTCIDTFNAGASQYFGNIGSFKITYKNGTSKTYWPKDSAEVYGCQVESDTNLGYVYAGGFVKYANVNTKDIVSIEITNAGNAEQCTHGYVDVRLNSEDGMTLASLQTFATSGWGEYVTRKTSEIGSNGGYDTTDVYLVFRSGKEYELTDADRTVLKNADAVIISGGTQENDSQEGSDRNSLTLPRDQETLIRTVAGLNDNVVLYLQTVNMVDIEDVKDDVDAILWTCYNGQAQGNAMARILFGKVNPTAKLPFTWYSTPSQLPAITDYAIRGSKDSLGRTYQYFRGDVSWAFGHGLSYTTFDISDVKFSKTAVTPDDTITVTAKVKNTGKVDGAEVVQVYVASPKADGIDRPFKELKGFTKVFLAAGETKEITIDLPVQDWYFCDEETGRMLYDQGKWTVEVATSSDKALKEQDVTLSGDLTPVLQSVELDADAVVLYSDAAEGITSMNTKLSAVLSNDTALENPTVTYKSNNENVATVDEKGVITAVSAGVCTITATVTYEGKTITDSVPVVVKGTAKFEEGSLTSGRYTIQGQVPMGGKLRVTELPEDHFFYGLFEFLLGGEEGNVPEFYALGFDVVWNYEAQPTDKMYKMSVTLPEDASVTQVLGVDKLSGENYPIDFTMKDGVLTFEANGSGYYAIVGSGVAGDVGLLGDVDGDGAITSTDARLTLQFYAGKIEASDLNTAVADVDGDGAITSTDARLILQKYAGKIDKFPAE
ncbi:MAG: glycoside hydrolase family 3 C-terminal domain-containing protein [Clostridia bacterium]|nr:glycoside hydrolase family 3 C-terminal domain-containing protein [Clostridia bacterium]